MPASAVYQLALKGSLPRSLPASGQLSGQPPERESDVEMRWKVSGHAGSGSCAASYSDQLGAGRVHSAAAESARRGMLSRAAADGLLEVTVALVMHLMCLIYV